MGWINTELLKSSDVLVLWNYPGYNLSDIGSSSLPKIRESHMNLIKSIRKWVNPNHLTTYGYSLGGFPSIQNSQLVDKVVVYKSFWSQTATARGLSNPFLSYLYHINISNSYCLSHLFNTKKDINIIFSHKDSTMRLDSSLLYGYHYYITKLLR